MLSKFSNKRNEVTFRVAKNDGSQVFHIFVWQSSKPDILIGEQNMKHE